MALTTGTRLGPYEIHSAIGAGGMGEVYRARDPRLARDVAIKILPPPSRRIAERLHRFEQEARAAAALNHPNILAVYDIGQERLRPARGASLREAEGEASGGGVPASIEEVGSPYIVSELLEGETLRERLQKASAARGAAGPASEQGALPVRKAVEYAVQICHGLAAAHEKGITHRDLKPENLFLTTDGRVKILDFGLAKLTQPEAALAGASALPTTPAIGQAHTVPGMVLGTVGYMAPEQVRGQEADHRSDIFSFGAILYEMLSGQRAFHRETAAETMTAILKEEPPDLSAQRQTPPGAGADRNPLFRETTGSTIPGRQRSLFRAGRGCCALGRGHGRARRPCSNASPEECAPRVGGGRRAVGCAAGQVRRWDARLSWERSDERAGVSLDHSPARECHDISQSRSGPGAVARRPPPGVCGHRRRSTFSAVGAAAGWTRRAGAGRQR